MYTDSLYATTITPEPVVQDVLDSKAMRRLHGVLQHGITAVLGITQPITRYQHSVGAMLVVRRMGGDVREQLAALLHDISHTAFSHVIDHVWDSAATQSYHDRVKESYVAETDLPAVLAAHGYDWRELIDETQFPLLEQPAPALCADRLDYFLRDARALGLATQEDVQRVLAHLVVHDGRLMVNDPELANWLGMQFMAADHASWSNWREVGLYELTALAIRRGLAVGAITEADFWLTDAVVWHKLHAHPDAELHHWLDLVHPETSFVWDEEMPTFTVTTKIRTIDPDVVQKGVARPLSTLSPAFAAERESYIGRKSVPWPMRALKNK
ncbi:MAG: HD domain-containing protein [Chloroflexi bacterium]|nr:HD domain-containing protein [Chloroflexota bacterium]